LRQSSGCSRFLRGFVADRFLTGFSVVGGAGDALGAASGVTVADSAGAGADCCAGLAAGSGGVVAVTEEGVCGAACGSVAAGAPGSASISSWRSSSADGNAVVEVSGGFGAGCSGVVSAVHSDGSASSG
jgi:hypothetical protein